MTSLFKQRSTGREVKVKLIEFLYFYLMPEATAAPVLSSPTTPASTDAERTPGGAGPRGGLARANSSAAVSSAAGGKASPHGINKSPSKHNRAQSQMQIRTQPQLPPQSQIPPQLPPRSQPPSQSQRQSQSQSQSQSQNPMEPPSRKGTKTTSEKQALLGRYLSNVEALIEDLRDSAPFGVSAPLA